MNNSIAIIIPMFNEEKVATKCINAVVNILRKNNIDAKLIVINDGSKDNTGELLKEMLKKYQKYLIVETHKKNKGYGAATKTGIKKAIKSGFTWCLHMDSDLTNDPKDIPRFVNAISNDVDCIKASRYMRNSKILNVQSYRRIISLVGNYLASFLFNVGIKDCTNGFRLVRTDLIKGISFKENNFSIILEELYYLKKRHARFKEIAYILTVRKDSVSHFIYNPKVFYDYFKYLIKSALIFR